MDMRAHFVSNLIEPLFFGSLNPKSNEILGTVIGKDNMIYFLQLVKNEQEIPESVMNEWSLRYRYKNNGEIHYT